MNISIKDPKSLTTFQKLRLVRRAILYLMANLEQGDHELDGVVYQDYEHTGATVNITLK